MCNKMKEGIEREIFELENGDFSYRAVEKLSLLYDVQKHMKNNENKNENLIKHIHGLERDELESLALMYLKNNGGETEWL